MRRTPEDHDPSSAPEPAGPGDEGALPSPWVTGAHFSTYEIESRLACGGMAEVWRAKIIGVEGFEKRVVIKTMLTHLQHKPELVQMFISEASLAARLSHPNIVDVFDFGQLEGRYFIAMEYVPGVTLRFAHKRALARGARLPVAAALHVMRDVCEALQYIHELEDGQGELGLVHRDLSPDNIILSTSGTAKVIDFGAARATTRSPAGRVFVGKYRYAAPERVRHRGEDCRSDVYSAGVILYECLTGSRPFEGRDVDIINAITSTPACDPRVRAPSLPARVAETVMKATAQDPDDRFASARELGTALARCLMEIGASSKERDVTAAISALLEPEPEAGPPAPQPAVTEAVPEAIEASAREGTDGEDALCEVEILEASGRIRKSAEVSVADASDAETIRVALAAPDDGVPTPRRADTGSRPLPGAIPSAAISDPSGSRRIATGSGRVVTGSGPTDSGRVSTRHPTGRSLLAWRSTAPPPASNPAIEAAVEHFDRGLALRREGRFGEALAEWEQALALAPENRIYQSSVQRLRDQLGSVPVETEAVAADTQRYDVDELDAG